MKKHTSDKKQQEILNCLQFTENEKGTDSLIWNVEKDINILEMKKKLLARLYGLVKIHTNETPLRPVQPIPDGSYH